MSVHPRIRLDCLATGKRMYGSQAVAERELERWRRHPKDGKTSPARAYACPECGFWHVTGQRLTVGYAA